jgi:hypothetical protein
MDAYPRLHGIWCLCICLSLKKVLREDGFYTIRLPSNVLDTTKKIMLFLQLKYRIACGGACFLRVMFLYGTTYMTVIMLCFSLALSRLIV